MHVVRMCRQSEVVVSFPGIQLLAFLKYLGMTVWLKLLMLNGSHAHHRNMAMAKEDNSSQFLSKGIVPEKVIPTIKTFLRLLRHCA
jgi:hypothetical protein